MSQRFEDGWAAVNRKPDVLQAELRAFAVQLEQQPPKPPEPPPGMGPAHPNGAKQFNVSTPPRTAPPDNPFYMPGTGMPGMPQTFNGFGQPGEAPHTPNRPVGHHNNSGDFGLDSVSLSGSLDGNNQCCPPNAKFQQRNASSMNVDGTHNHATHRQHRTPNYSNHVHAPMWTSQPNDDFKISRKQISDLPMFDGDFSKYSHWKNKLSDHCADTNYYWRAILKHIQEANGTIDYHQLVRVHYGKSTGWDLSLELWNFISKRIGQTIYDTRVQLANGVDGNGFELWRALFVQFEGGDEFVKLGGRTDLQNFPPITSMNGITDKLRDWQHQMSKYGSDIGHITRKTMLLKVLPDHLRQDLLKYGMNDCDKIIAWITQTQTWSRTEEMMKKRRGAVTPVLPNYGNGPAPGGCDVQDAASPPVVSPELIAAIVAAVGGKPNVAAVGQTRGRELSGNRSPRARSPRSKSPRTIAREKLPKNHWYHCNSPDHSRTANAKSGRAGCSAFAKILKDNGDKLPDGYKGAFEKHMDAELAKQKTKPKKISAIADRELYQWHDEDSDSSDSDSDRPCDAIWQTVGPRCCDPFASDLHFPAICEITSTKTPTKNSYDALSDLDDSPSLAEPAPTIEQATTDLKKWAHRVTTKSDKQPRKKDFVVKTDDDVKKLEKMFCGANREKSAKALRQIENENLDELAALVERRSSSLGSVEKSSRRVWAMVDSGPFVTIANCAKAFP